MKLRFINVGREKKCWESTFIDYHDSNELENMIELKIYQKGELMSSDIGFILDTNTKKGYITAGIKHVGNIEIIEPALHNILKLNLGV